MDENIMSHKRILIVVTNYEDESKISSRRWRYLSEYLAGKGYEVSVISHDGKESERKIVRGKICWYQLPNDNSVRRVSIRQRNKDRFFVFLLCYREIMHIKSIQKLSRKINKSMQSGILKEAVNGRYDVVISSVYNLDAFHIGLIFQHKCKIEHHICDIRDPIIRPFFSDCSSAVIGRKNAKKIIKNTDCLLTVSEEIIKDFHKVGLYPKVNILPHAFLEYDKTTSSEYKLRTLVIAYVGTFYYDRYKIDPLLEAFLKLREAQIGCDQIQFVVAGKNSEVLEKRFDDLEITEYLDNKGFVSHEDAVKIQKNADVLVFINEIEYEGRYVGCLGKFPEYVASNKEVLMLFDTKDTAVRQLDFFNSLCIGLCVDTNRTEAGLQIYDWIVKKLSEKKGGQVIHEPNLEGCSQFSIHNVGEKLERIIEGL